MDVVIVRSDPDDVVRSSADETSTRFSHLPKHIDLADTISSADTVTRSGPESPRDPEQEWMLRYAVV
jgi:hypothetical protein